jgi:hypothetical protein
LEAPIDDPLPVFEKLRHSVVPPEGQTEPKKKKKSTGKANGKDATGAGV